MLPPIQVNTPMYWECKPWVDNKLITIDGYGRFATVDFDVDSDGNDYIIVKPLCDFPKKKITDRFWAFPESQTVCVWDMILMHIYNKQLNMKDSLVPIFSRVLHCYTAFQLNPYELILAYDWDGDVGYLTYNMKTKKTDLEEGKKCRREQIYFQLAPYSTKFIAGERIRKNSRAVKYFLFDYETKEHITNELTDKLTELFSSTYYKYININFEKRMLISDSNDTFLTWDENYENVKIIPFDFLVPKDKYIGKIVVSKNFNWVLLEIGGYRGAYDEHLSKYAFMKIDEKNPALVGPLVILDDYWDESSWKFISFFEHKKYGTCLFYTSEDSKRKKTKGFFYKMSDIEKELEK